MSSVMRFDEWQDSNGVPVLDGAGGGLALGKILQVVSAIKTNSQSTTSGTLQDITDLAVTITPASTSSKFAIFLSVAFGNSTDISQATMVHLARDATVLGNSTAGSVFNGFSFGFQPLASIAHASINFLDSPNTISAITYKGQFRVAGASTAYINRRGANADYGASSSIVVMEVAG